MNKAELLKVAKENKEVADALVFLTKTSAEATQFDESVPAVPGAVDQSGGQAAAPAQGAAPVPGAAPATADQQALQMAGAGGQGPMPIDPAEEGAKAARSFLAPAFQAAAQGDPGAQQVIAMAAGAIAKGVAEAADAAGQGQQMPEPPPAPVQSPEQAAADQIVAAPTQAKVAAKPESEESEAEKTKKKDKGDKGDKKPPFEKKSELVFSADTVKGLVELAKAGII